MIPAGPRGTTVLVMGIVRDARGRTVVARELGAGAVVAPAGVVTTYDVLESARGFLKSGELDAGHRLFVAVAPSGALELTFDVESVVTFDETVRDDQNLALLQLAENVVLRRATLAPPGRGPLVWLPPGQQPQELELRLLTNREQAHLTDPSEATLLRFAPKTSGGLPPPPGTPLYSGSDLAGLALGSSVRGMAVTSRQIQLLLDHAATAPADLLSPR